MSVEVFFVRIVRDENGDSFLYFIAQEGSFVYEVFMMTEEERQQYDNFIRSFIYVPPPLQIIFIQ